MRDSGVGRAPEWASDLRSVQDARLIALAKERLGLHLAGLAPQRVVPNRCRQYARVSVPLPRPRHSISRRYN